LRGEKPTPTVANALAIIVAEPRENGKVQKRPTSGYRRRQNVNRLTRELLDSLIRATNARRRASRLLVHPAYGAVKLPKINKETNLWQFPSATAAKRREEGGDEGGRSTFVGELWPHRRRPKSLAIGCPEINRPDGSR